MDAYDAMTSRRRYKAAKSHEEALEVIRSEAGRHFDDYDIYWREEPCPMEHPLGAALRARREAIEEVGLLDERFFIYGEEIDWCLRMKKAGGGIYGGPRAQVVHHEAKSTRQVRGEMFVALWRSRYLLFEKHYGRFYQWAVRRIVRLGLWAEKRRALAAYERGEMSKGELESCLVAYRAVAEMS